MFQITKKVTAGDLYSQEQFQLYQSQYTEANRYRDQFTRLEVKQELPEITEDRVMTVNGPRPWWTKKKWFYILSCLSISIFQRFVKKIGKYPRFFKLINLGHYFELNPRNAHWL